MKKAVRRKADPRRWTEKFLNVIPAVDVNGEPIPQNPQLNTKGFWKKPERTLSHELDKVIKEVKERVERKEQVKIRK